MQTFWSKFCTQMLCGFVVYCSKKLKDETCQYDLKGSHAPYFAYITCTLFCQKYLFRYSLLQLLRRCGKIKDLDFLFHKSGPLQGQCRGFSFATFYCKEVIVSCLCIQSGSILHDYKDVQYSTADLALFTVVGFDSKTIVNNSFVNTHFGTKKVSMGLEQGS